MEYIPKKIIKNCVTFIGILTITTLLALLIGKIGGQKENALMVFMVGILFITAFTSGYQYGVLGSFVAVMIFNYFFTAPKYTFFIGNSSDIVLILFFLMASIMSSSLAMRFEKQLQLTQQKGATAELLYEMSEGFVNVTGKGSITDLGISFIRKHTGYDCVVSLQKEDIHKDVGSVFPIIGVTKQIGLLEVKNKKEELSSEQKLLIKATANQIGIALDRELIYEEQQETKIQIEKEQMKSSMLRSISHDFRTPLTGIIGDCGYLLEVDELDMQTVKQFASEINEQSIWLMKMMENILNMTKIESGHFQLRTQPEVVDDIVNEAVTHAIGLWEKRNFKVDLPEQVIVSNMDGKMMVQVIINLLDNAIKHTKEQGSISLKISYEDYRVYFVVEDDGDGIEIGMEEQIFQEFISFSQDNGDKKRGIGLGLTICKEVVKAHRGEIWAENKEEGGARFVFWLHAEQVGIDG